MSEGASGSSNTVIKRSSDVSSSSESGAKRFHADQSTSDVVMLLDDSEVSLAVSRCREVCRDSVDRYTSHVIFLMHIAHV